MSEHVKAIEHDVRITVLRKVKTGEILKDYGASTVTAECPAVKEGATYVSSAGRIPEGFCGWAWADMQRDIAVLAFGGDFPWIKKDGTMISCCTDGLRPVIFKLERVL
jgi:uncharacterized repeat protein (TIGR04076 family)